MLDSRSRQKNIRGLHTDFEFVEIIILQDFDMVQTAFDHRIRAGFPIFFQQVLFQGSAFTPIRMEQLLSRAALITSRTRSSDPILQG